MIQALLSRLLNPGELEWLQLLNRREELAQQHTALQVSWLRLHAHKQLSIGLEVGHHLQSSTMHARLLVSQGCMPAKCNGPICLQHTALEIGLTCYLRVYADKAVVERANNASSLMCLPLSLPAAIPAPLRTPSSALHRTLSQATCLSKTAAAAAAGQSQRSQSCSAQTCSSCRS